MFPVDAQYTGRKLDEKYVSLRARWEPMYEVTQIKGDGEAHPLLSPDDTFADYETWDTGNLGSQPKPAGALPYEYARSALKLGLVMRRGDDRDLADARQHQHRQRIIDHRLVVDRHHLL